jgi:hypothetical protein
VRFARLLEEAGMEVSTGDEWGRYDLHVRAHPGYAAVVESVVEHQSQIRFRARTRSSPALLLLQAALTGLILLALLVPAMVPLLVPLVGCLWTVWKERHRMDAALALVGRKAGETLDMVPLDLDGTDPVGKARVGKALHAPARLSSQEPPRRPRAAAWHHRSPQRRNRARQRHSGSDA